jgi:sarcosine oxidase, subunit gamma
MSDPVSALNGAQFAGFAQIEEAPLTGMMTLRGDLGSAKVKKAIKSATGTKVPATGRIELNGGSAAAWMSPDELLVIVPYDEVAERLDALQVALAGEHALAVNVSDARAMFRISGPDAREVPAKLCPVDMSADVFTPNTFRRTRMAQVAAAFWMDGDGTISVVCFRSVAGYVFNLLSAAAHPQSKVGVFGTISQ